MRRAFSLALILTVLVVGCSKKSEPFALNEGTAAYTLAKELSGILPVLDPAANKVLVTAKGFEITSGEVIQAIQNNIGNRTVQLKQLDGAQLKQVIEQGAVQLGEKKLMLNAAAKAKTVVSPEELDKVLQQQYDSAGDEHKFLERLASNGISLDYVKSSIQENLQIRKYLDSALAAQSAVSEEEFLAAHQQDKTASVRHILLLTEGKRDQEKADIRQKMEAILARAKGGEDFAALAKQYSEDPGSKDNGGLYEDFGRGQMVKPFEDAAFSVPVGEISGIVETQYGYHIIQVVDRKKDTRPLNEARAELEAQFKQTKQGQAFQALMDKLKADARLKTVAW